MVTYQKPERERGQLGQSTSRFANIALLDGRASDPCNEMVPRGV
jgi:hypothetical protein